ncbi:MAG: hypothetical protein PVH88_00425 [Ignavibacteria bacterium]|jgi:hypothetical protein
MNVKEKIKNIMSAVGPGLFLIEYNIGKDSVTSMDKAGVKYGMSLFWALVPFVLFTYILMCIVGLIADLVQEGMRLLIPGLNVNTIIITSIPVILLYVMLWIGRYLFLKR